MPVASPYAALLSEVPPVESIVEVLGSTTHYWTYGPTDAALTILAVHGYRGEHHGLEPVVAHLRGIRVIAPDLPAFGRSTPLAGAHDIDGYAHWLGAFVTVLGLQDAIVLGHSFGSIVVAHAVARGDIAPSRLILINPIAGLPAVAAPVIGAHRVAAVFGERVGKALIGGPVFVWGMSRLMTVTHDPTLRRFVRDQHSRYFSDFASMRTVIESFRASVTRTVTEVAGALTMPTLLIGAARDQISSEAAVRALAERIPGSTLVMLRDVGHLIHYEKPREAAAAIVDFLGEGRLA